MQNHYDYQNEKEHLDIVKEKISKKEKEILEIIQKFNKKDYSGNKKQEVSEIEVDGNTIKIYTQELQDIEEIKPSPYFARMDFQFDGEEKPEKIYIGKKAVTFDTNDLRYNIIDWRAPLAKVYYEGNLGDCIVTVKNKDGKPIIIKGKKFLKRSIDIKDGKIVKIQDLETLAETKAKEMELADNYLIECLKESSDIRLKEIIATIQKEQNQIIREDLNHIVYIQGAAGSGKSTIALHRIAYILYQYDQTIEPKDILVIAPNKLFLSYISSVLPDLGVENIKQITYKMFVEMVMGESIPVDEELDEEKYLDISMYNEIIKIKGELEYKTLLDTYVQKLILGILPSSDLSIFNLTVFSKKELENILFNYFGNYKINDRIDRFKEFIETKTNEKIQLEADNIRNLYDEKIEFLKKQLNGHTNLDKEIRKLLSEKEVVVNNYINQAQMILKHYLNSIKKIDAIEAYINLITDKDLMMILSYGLIDQDKVDKIVKLGCEGLKEHDIAPIFYIYTCINDISKWRYKHIVIDESQDLSSFELYTLKEYSSNNSFTIVGDTNQSIIPYKDIRTESKVKSIFNFDKNLKWYNLNKSYRSTYEIIMFANELLKFHIEDKKLLSIPLNRRGSKPKIYGKENINEVIDTIVDLIKNKEDKIKNTAIVLRNTKKAIEYYELLKGKINVNLITNKTIEYVGGVSVIPAYLTKGLEFDYVIVADCDSKSYKDNMLDRNLLYVQFTRAMHKLDILYYGAISQLISKIGSEYYEIDESEEGKFIKLRENKTTLLELLKIKFNDIPEDIERLIKEEDDYYKLRQYINRVLSCNTIQEIFQ